MLPTAVIIASILRALISFWNKTELVQFSQSGLYMVLMKLYVGKCHLSLVHAWLKLQCIGWCLTLNLSYLLCLCWWFRCGGGGDSKLQEDAVAHHGQITHRQGHAAQLFGGGQFHPV